MKNANEIIIADVLNAFSAVANISDALAMSKYMRNRFQFFGIKSELRKMIQKELLSVHKLPEGEELKDFVEKLWALPQRELHYFAMEILEKPIKKADDSWMPLLEKLVSTNSWWDSVDAIASKLIGNYLVKHPEYEDSYPEKWIQSENFWFRRTALLYQLKYKKNTNFERLKDFVLRTANEKEFFIQKAQGWALREYAKTNPEAVRNFVSENEKVLSPLTKREALKNM
jgi:3-methyladenine DNA glycosylase AlkD